MEEQIVVTNNSAPSYIYAGPLRRGLREGRRRLTHGPRSSPVDPRFKFEPLQGHAPDGPCRCCIAALAAAGNPVDPRSNLSHCGGTRCTAPRDQRLLINKILFARKRAEQITHVGASQCV